MSHNDDLEDIKKIRKKARTAGRIVGYFLPGVVATGFVVAIMSMILSLMPLSLPVVVGIGAALMIPIATAYAVDLSLRSGIIANVLDFDNTRIEDFPDLIRSRFWETKDKGSPVTVFLKNLAFSTVFASPLGLVTKLPLEAGKFVYNVVRKPAPGKPSFLNKLFINPDKIEDMVQGKTEQPKAKRQRLQKPGATGTPAAQPAEESQPATIARTSGITSVPPAP